MILWWCKIYLRCQVTVLVYMGNICISGRYLSLHKLFRITEWRSYSGKWTVRRVYLAFLWCYFWWNIPTSMLAALLWRHIRSLLSLAHIVRTTVKKNPKSFILCGSNACMRESVLNAGYCYKCHTFRGLSGILVSSAEWTIQSRCCLVYG